MIQHRSENELANRKEFPYCKDYPFIFAGSNVITSKLTSKSQTTVPQAVRKALGLKPGDRVVYEIENGQVILTREGGATSEDPFGSFDEWRGENDEEAYADL